MKFGVWTPLPHTIKREPRIAAAIDDALMQGSVAGPDKGFAFSVEVLQEAERLGFCTSLVAERLMGPDLESWIHAAALATQTSKLELIVAVHPGIYTPQTAAKMITTLDRISGGRAAVNIVNGWYEEEFTNYSNGNWLESSDARYVRMREFMTVLRGMTENEDFSFVGEYYKVDKARLVGRPVQRQIPIYAASSNEIGKSAIADLAHCWMLLPSRPGAYENFDEAFEAFRVNIDEVKARSAKAGRVMRIGLTTHVIACETDAEAHERAREMEAYGQEHMMNRVVALAIGGGLVGSYDTVAERLCRYRDAGVDTTMFHFHPMMEGMRTFMNEVVPRMRPAA